MIYERTMLPFVSFRSTGETEGPDLHEGKASDTSKVGQRDWRDLRFIILENQEGSPSAHFPNRDRWRCERTRAAAQHSSYERSNPILTPYLLLYRY